VTFVLTGPHCVGGARIAGLGAAQPAGFVDGAAITAPFGKTAEWLRERTGIRRIRRLADGENLLDLAERAGRDALGDAGIAPHEIDEILVATCSNRPPGRPDLATRLAQRLHAAVPAYDVNSACAGFCFALTVAAGLVGIGQARTVLVVGAERMSALCDPADLGTSILFGDGAGAAVVTSAATNDIAPAAWSSDGSRGSVLEIPDGDPFLRMQGQQVFRWAVDEVHKVATEAIDKAGLRAEDIDVFVPHQANLRIVEAIRRRLHLHDALTATDIETSGNTSAASIPIALSRLRAAGHARGGQLALLTGFGAGLTIAAQVVRLP
jgi:3-oxoacyl-[acyl-carrier-protein] synthase-3